MNYLDMKKLFALAFLVFLSATTIQASILILDQSASAPAGNFSTFTAAQTAAVNGDTILVIPNSATYGSIAISKPLVLMGIGFNPDNEFGLTSTFTSIVINVGVADGTQIIGVVSNSVTIGNTSGTVSNILIENCQIAQLTHSATVISNVIIRQNLFQTATNTIPITLTAGNQSNIIVTNNLFSSTGTAVYGPYVSTGGVIFDHNIFLTSSRGAFYQLVNSVVRNNIFYGRNITSETGFTNVLFENNLSFNATTMDLPPTSGTNVRGTNNLVNQDPQFVNLPAGTSTFNFTMDANLNTGSVALLAGADGTDLGVYGGSSPYKDSGSVLPVVKQFIMPSNVQQGTDTNADVIITGN